MESPRQRKILIVEDHRDMLVIMKKYLEDQNFTIIEAETAEIGLEKYNEDKPDLILMDIMLPGMSGLDAVNKIKKMEQNNSYTPILIITAKKDVDDIVEGLDTGADDYIVKPFNFDELIARINTALRLKSLNELLVRQSIDLEEANTKNVALNQSLLQKNKELRKNVYNLHTLFEITMELNSILDFQRLINSTLLTLVGQFSIKNALFLFALKQNENRLTVLNSKGFYQKDVKDLVLQKSDPIFKYLKSTAYPTSLPELSKKKENSKAVEKLRNLKLEIAAPVIIQGNIEGLICLGARVRNQQYEPTDMEHISILTNIISIAVSNASLYNEVKQLSYTDGMTELHNFRYFELRLKEEVTRDKRTKTGLSLLILDVDFFKNYNDTMGHPAGDEVLRKLAHILKDTVRENDIVARYGGEEFAVILPAIDTDGAYILAERIRTKVEETYFEHEEIQPNGKVTVSIGGAALPEHATTYKDLIYKADTAMYAAKNSGRNQVQMFNPEMVQ